MALINSGVRAGGQLATLLEQISKNLRNQQLLHEKVKSSVGSYVIFVTVAVCFGAPLLFGLSTVLVTVLSSILNSLDIGAAAGGALPVTFSKVAVTPGFIMMYSILSLSTSAFLGSLVLGLINKGRAREGLRYFPGILLLALTVYLVVEFSIKSIFVNLGLLTI